MFASYVVDNDRKFRDGISRALSASSDLRIPFTLIQADFYRSEQAIFKLQSEGLYPPISEKYGKAKEKKVGFKYPLLVRSGRLAASLLSANSPDSISAIEKLSLTFGTRVPYGVYHQSDAPRKKIPLRKFLFIGPEAPSFATSDQMGRLERWLNILNDYVLQVGKRSGAFSG